MALLVDYRSGALGRVSLETPESRNQMIVSNAPVAEPITPEVLIEEDEIQEKDQES